MKTALGWTAGVIALLLVAWGAFHFFIPTINPAQVAPAGHPGAACWTCHMVTQGAELVETD